ncbi:MAG: DUF2117 domain-containing protein [Candidatus Methanodesulfokora washburnensis]|jgi:hypothetical protein
MQKILLLFHMPAIFDSGWACKLLQALRECGKVEAVVTGVMGPTAMLDSYLENEVRFLKEDWKQWIKSSIGKYDIMISAMHATTPERSKAYCWHLLRILGKDAPLIGVDTNNRLVIPWNNKIRNFAEEVARKIGFSVEEPVDYGETLWIESGRKYRRVLAVSAGDYILINGLVVGKALSGDVIIVEENGKIIDIKGAQVKRHGLDKLGDIKLEEAKVDTITVLRESPPIRRTFKLEKEDKIAFIDHAGFKIYKFIENKISGAVSVGDDTTTVVGDILSRYSIPIIGIIDEDPDQLLREVRYADGSLILHVTSDDQFGKLVFREIFKNRDLIDAAFDELKDYLVRYAREKGFLKAVDNYYIEK